MLSKNNESSTKNNDIYISDIRAENVQIIVANEHAIVETSQNNNDKALQLDKLISTIRENLPYNISHSDLDILNQNLENIRLEIARQNPRKTYLKNIINSLKSIKGVAEFGAAITTLIEFVNSFFS